MRDGARRHLQGPPAGRRLDPLEIQPVDGTGPYQRSDLGDDFRLEGLFEAPFFAASVSAAAAPSSVSAHLSQACQYCSSCSRN
jgi:hypothetical protein